MRAIEQKESVSTFLRWFIMMAIIAAFFVANHDILYPVQRMLRDSPQELMATVEEGNLLRRVAFISMALMGIVLIAIRPRLGHISSPSLLLMLFLGWMAISVIWSDNPLLTIRRFTLFVCLTLAATGVSRTLSPRDLRTFVFASGAVFLLLGLLAEIVLGTFNPLSSDYRFAGTRHPNLQGVNCGLLVLAIISMIRERLIRYRAVLWTLALIGFAALLMTRSRIAIAACMAGLFIISAPQYNRSKHSMLAVLSYAMVMVTGILLIMLFEVWNPFLGEAVRIGRADSTTLTLSGRIPLWEELIPYIWERPFIGYGYEGFWYPKRIVEVGIGSGGWTASHEHSIYLKLLLGLGLIGTGLFCGLIAILFIKVIKKSRITHEYRFLLALIVFGALHGILETALLTPDLLLFLFLWLATEIGFPRFRPRFLLLTPRRNMTATQNSRGKLSL
jgi:O-antigen ligase